MSRFTRLKMSQSKGKWFLLLLVIVVVVTMCLANPLDQPTMMKRNLKRMCGPTLSNTLRMVCKGRYNKRGGGVGDNGKFPT